MLKFSVNFPLGFYVVAHSDLAVCARPRNSARSSSLAVLQFSRYALAAATLSGCMAAPVLERPKLSAATVYGAPTLTAATAATAALKGGESQQFLAGKPVPQQWWRQFGSEQLNALVQQALDASPSVAAAQASLREKKS